MPGLWRCVPNNLGNIWPSWAHFRSQRNSRAALAVVKKHSGWQFTVTLHRSFVINGACIIRPLEYIVICVTGWCALFIINNNARHICTSTWKHYEHSSFRLYAVFICTVADIIAAIYGLLSFFHVQRTESECENSNCQGHICSVTRGDCIKMFSLLEEAQLQTNPLFL